MTIIKVPDDVMDLQPFTYRRKCWVCGKSLAGLCDVVDMDSDIFSAWYDGYCSKECSKKQRD